MVFKNEEIPSLYTEDYKTLHHDIGLVRRSNGLWDLWFGQDEISKNYKNDEYLRIVDGDLVTATEIHSLQVGIIIACLTSWNYLNRTGNPIYTEFGNESYSLLKKNKGINTQYKIEQFFIDCLNRMRRVYSIEYLNVYEIENNPYLYKVVFKVISVTNTIVDGEFYLETDANKNTSMLEIEYNHPYTSASNPLFIEGTLKNEYGSIIQGEIVYIYIKGSHEQKFKFYGITEATDDNGKVYITIPPKGLDFNTQIMLVFRGNSLYNPCVSKIIGIQSVAYYIKSRYTYKIVDGKKTNEIDKQILYVEDSEGRGVEKFRLGELLSDYIDISTVISSIDNPPQEITLENIESNYLNEDYRLEWDEIEENDDVYSKNNKLFLIPTNRTISGTEKKYYKAYGWSRDGTKLRLWENYDIQLNTNNPYEVHFLIHGDDNGLFEIDFDDGHLYYQIDLIENEF